MENKLISVKKYDKIVKDLIEELEKKYVEGRENIEKEDESFEILARMTFTLQNIMVFTELRKKLFEEN